VETREPFFNPHPSQGLFRCPGIVFRYPNRRHQLFPFPFFPVFESCTVSKPTVFPLFLPRFCGIDYGLQPLFPPPTCDSCLPDATYSTTPLQAVNRYPTGRPYNLDVVRCALLLVMNFVTPPLPLLFLLPLFASPGSGFSLLP